MNFDYKGELKKGKRRMNLSIFLFVLVILITVTCVVSMFIGPFKMFWLSYFKGKKQSENKKIK